MAYIRSCLHTAAVPVIVSRYVLWADIGKAQLWCQAVRESNTTCQYVQLPSAVTNLTKKHSDITKLPRTLIDTDGSVDFTAKYRWDASCQLVRKPITGL